MLVAATARGISRGGSMRHYRSRTRLTLAIASGLVAALVLSQSALAAVSATYKFAGVEVWATHTVGTFVGAAVGSAGDGATWRAAIEHTVQTQPSGSITGGYAELVTTDLTRIRGDFSKGTLTLISIGSGACGNLTHKVWGKLVRVTRSDRAGAIGTGRLVGKLVHYRIMVFGNCIAYSASAKGTFYLNF